METFDTVAECMQAKDAVLAGMKQMDKAKPPASRKDSHYAYGLSYQCITSDDPRLKN